MVARRLPVSDWLSSAFTLRPLTLVLAMVACGVVGGLSGCGYFEPCQILAERVCSCELTEGLRTACRSERITNGSDSIAHTEEETEACSAALETCTCAALDNHDTDECAFMNKGGAIPESAPQDPEALQSEAL